MILTGWVLYYACNISSKSGMCKYIGIIDLVTGMFKYHHVHWNIMIPN